MGSVEDWIALVGSWYATFGYVLVFAGTLGENTALLGLILPGGTLAALGAFYARTGTLNLAWVILLAWLGTVAGYHVDYLVGRYALRHGLERWGRSRLGRRLRLAARMRLARRFLARHGGKAIVLSHTAGHLRSFVALSAGATRMSYPRFLAFEALAALIWSSLFCAVGYLIGAELGVFLAILERIGWTAFALIVALALGSFIAHKVRQSRKRRRSRRRPSANSVPLTTPSVP
ncbi:MAG TPA: DedA family protein [Ktedonobacterales bacterium]